MDKLAAMETFVSIVDEGSLSAAAKAQAKALPTIVRSLALLEESLGVTLLKRTTRRMSLTDEGRSYLDRCRRILADVSEAEEELTNAQLAPRGKIRITAPLLFGGKKLAPVIREFLREYPEVQVELFLADRVVDIVSEGFDLGLRIAHLPDSSLLATRIGAVTRTLVASPQLLKQEKRPQHPNDLKERPSVHFSGGAPGSQMTFLIDGKKTQVPPQGSFSCNNAQVAIEACVDGLGFGQFLSYQVSDLVHEGKLVRLLKKYEVDPIPVHLVYPSSRGLSGRTRLFLNWAKERLRGSSGLI